MAVAATTEAWLGLLIGNTRLHWALFKGKHLVGTWHTAHGSASQVTHLLQHQFAPAAWSSWMSAVRPLPPLLETIAQRRLPPPPLCCASVVPAQTELWTTYGNFQHVQLDDVPLTHTYPTLGIDRALNVIGAGDRYGWPALVIDAGTAFTITAGNHNTLIGGAILPGLRTQLQSLSQQTAALPLLQTVTDLPPRWANSTPEAIRSGVVYGLLATLQNFEQSWHRQYPAGHLILTGGDAPQVHQWYAQIAPDRQIHLDPDLAFWGLCRCRQQL